MLADVREKIKGENVFKKKLKSHKRAVLLDGRDKRV